MKNTEPLTICIVDDDELFLKSMKYFLQQKISSAVQINLFQTGEEFLKNITEKKPDVVILDYVLNGFNPHAMDGRSVLRKIKQTNPEMAVIMISGQNRIEVALESIREGAYDYVIKNDNVFFKIHATLKNIIKNITTSKRLKKYKLWLTGAILFLVVGVGLVMVYKLFL